MGPSQNRTPEKDHPGASVYTVEGRWLFWPNRDEQGHWRSKETDLLFHLKRVNCLCDIRP